MKDYSFRWRHLAERLAAGGDVESMDSLVKCTTKKVLCRTRAVTFAEPCRLAKLVLAVTCTLASIACGGGPNQNTGQPTNALVCLSPKQLNFGTVSVGSSSPPQTATITSCGSASLHITSINDPAGGFHGTNTCPVGGTLNINSTCQIQETFAPNLVGSEVNVCVNIVSDSSLSPDCLQVSGTGD